MDTRLDRRNSLVRREGILKQSINEEQLVTLCVLERFGWLLKFVRSGPNAQPIAAVFDPEKQTLAIIDPDGELIENPGIDFRH